MKKSIIATVLTTLALVLPGCTNNNGLDKYTIMVYMCGSDLESGYDGYSVDPGSAGLASLDIFEMAYAYNQPKNVNIIIETGGSRAWNNGKIDAKKLQRWHIENRALVPDATLNTASMGKASTFQDFLEWGLTTYPAKKTGVIMWNHGGAMGGVCQDEIYNDMLLNSEVQEALKGAFESTNRTEKLEWIGYDACLMQVQDIAETNSNYFNYMIAAQESEAGTGWEYDSWLDDLYSGKKTEEILTAVCDGFVDSFSKSYPSRGNDQTLSFLDLSKIGEYKAAFEELSDKIYSTVSSKTQFQSMMKNVKEYGTTVYSKDELEASGIDCTNPSSSHYYTNYGFETENGVVFIDHGYNSFGVFDVVDFLNKLGAQYSGLTSEINKVKDAYNDLLVYNRAGSAAGESNGLCLFFSMNRRCHPDEYYTSDETRFTSWSKVVDKLGEY